MSNTYKAAIVRSPAGPDSVEIIDIPVQEPGPGQVLVNIAGAAINPVDLGVVAGVFHQLGLVRQRPYVGLGWDFAGTVAATGSGVDIPVGSRVAGLIDGFDRDYGTYAEQLVAPAINTARVPDGLDLIEAATVPLNSLAAVQMLDLLGDGEGQRLLVTGAAGTLGAALLAFGPSRGWDVTGLARDTDEQLVRDLGADFTVEPSTGWDAVADAAALQDAGVELVRDGGRFVGVRPNAVPPEVRGVTTRAVVSHPDGARLKRILDATLRDQLPVRVHATVPLDDVATALTKVAQGGIRGKYVIAP